MTSDHRHMTSVRGWLNSGRGRLVALSAATVALAVAAPVSGTKAAVVPGGVAQGGQADAPSGCLDANAPSGVGDAGAAVNQICGVVVAMVGPSTGQLSAAIGPTIIGSTVIAPVTVSSGPVAVSWLRGPAG
jgi:hypothetical protein